VNSEKKHIVLITTWFPPIQGVAVNRMIAFAKYLDKKKFDVTVFTLLEKGGLAAEEMAGCSVKRFPNNRFFKLPTFESSDKKFRHYFKVVWKLFLLKTQKDIYKSWRKNVLSALNNLHLVKKIDVVISSFSPEAAHVVAYDFCKNNPSIKWIADMRDEMSQNPSISESEKKKYILIENCISKRIDALTTVSQPLVEIFRNTTMGSVKIIEEIRNGYDHDLLLPEYKHNLVFTITYCGIFYGANKPDIFFSAISDLVNEGKLTKEWQILFVGTSHNIRVPEKLKDNVKFIDRVSQEKSIEYMINSDVNLFLLPKSPRKGVYTGKLFDYLSVRKPILAIVNKEDVAAQLIIDLNAGFVASNEDVHDVKRMILKGYDLWCNNEKMQMDENGITQLHRKFQIQRLNLLIDKLLNAH